MIPASIFQQASKDVGFDLFVDADGRWGLRVSTASGTLRANARALFPLSKWAHIAASYDPASGTARLYLDGEEVASAKRKPGLFKPASAGEFQIAHSWRAAPLGVFNINGLDAAFDEVRVSDREWAERSEIDLAAQIRFDDLRSRILVNQNLRQDFKQASPHIEIASGKAAEADIADKVAPFDRRIDAKSCVKVNSKAGLSRFSAASVVP